MVQTAMRLTGGDQQKALPRRFNFTVTSLAALKVPPGKDRIWVYDSTVPRLAYMLTGGGASSFYYYAKVNGRPVRYRLGDGELKIDQARRLAAGVMGKVAGGVNPQAERRAGRAEQTFGELFQWYLENHSKKHNRTWREDEAKYNLHLKPWSSRKFASITCDEVGRLHSKIGETSPGAANRVLALISSIFNRARLIGYSGINPAKGIRKYPEHQRERFITPDEMPRFMAALKKLDQDWRDFFELLLLTGVRSGNLKSAEWSEFNLDSATWTIPAAKFKTGKPLTITLTPEAMEILKRRIKFRPAPPMSQDAKPDPNFVCIFPAESESGHIEEPRKQWEALCESAKLVDLNIHDLRHTHATYMAATGANLSAIGRALGHRELKTTTRYINLDLDPIRKAVGVGVDAMMNAGKASKSKGK